MITVEPGFDRLLGGGLLPRNITHIYGEPASGKTNIALMATANASKDGKVVYVDPEGGFSVERLKQISKERINEVLGNVLLIEPTEYDEQKVAIKKLGDVVSKTDARLIVVDSIAVLYRLEGNKDSRELGTQLAQLLRTARRCDVPVLITNQVYTDINTGVNVAVGGDVTKYWSKIMIELRREGTYRIATLKKHKFLPEGITMRFKIVNEGMEEVAASLPQPAEYERREEWR